MKSLFNENDNNEVIARINKLTSQSTGQWGKMNVAQMLAHCTAPLKMAHGEVTSKRSFVGFIFGKMMKKKFVSGEPFQKNLPTDKKFIFADASEFELEKQKLVAQLQNFVKKGPGAVSKDPHPFFGPMTAKEWDIIQYKHLDHHLTQFGV